jgi:hypothetical protein
MLEKYYKILAIYNGIIQHEANHQNILYYTQTEAETYLEEKCKANNDYTTTYVIIPVYIMQSDTERYKNYLETVARINTKYISSFLN